MKPESKFICKFSKLNKSAEFSIVCPDLEIGKIVTVALSNDYHYVNVRLEYVEVLRFD